MKPIPEDVCILALGLLACIAFFTIGFEIGKERERSNFYSSKPVELAMERPPFTRPDLSAYPNPEALRRTSNSRARVSS